MWTFIFWLLGLYFIVCLIASALGVGTTAGASREPYWWEKVLMFPQSSLYWIGMKVPFLRFPINILLVIYDMMCQPLYYLFQSRDSLFEIIFSIIGLLIFAFIVYKLIILLWAFL